MPTTDGVRIAWHRLGITWVISGVCIAIVAAVVFLIGLNAAQAHRNAVLAAERDHAAEQRAAALANERLATETARRSAVQARAALESERSQRQSAEELAGEEAAARQVEAARRQQLESNAHEVAARLQSVQRTADSLRDENNRAAARNTELQGRLSQATRPAPQQSNVPMTSAMAFLGIRNAVQSRWQEAANLRDSDASDAYVRAANSLRQGLKVIDQFERTYGETVETRSLRSESLRLIASAQSACGGENQVNRARRQPLISCPP